LSSRWSAAAALAARIRKFVIPGSTTSRPSSRLLNCNPFRELRPSDRPTSFQIS